MCRDDPTRDPTYAASLLRRATELQIEAETLMQTLDLRAMLASLGPTEMVGSVVSGLMVWRDIEFCVADLAMKWGTDVGSIGGRRHGIFRSVPVSLVT